MDSIIQADRLERILRNFLNCHYSEFGVKDMVLEMVFR